MDSELKLRLWWINIIEPKNGFENVEKQDGTECTSTTRQTFEYCLFFYIKAVILTHSLQ